MSQNDDYKRGYAAGITRHKALVEMIACWAGVLKARPNRTLTATEVYNTLTIITGVTERSKDAVSDQLQKSRYATTTPLSN